MCSWTGTGTRYDTSSDSGGESGIVTTRRFPMPYAQPSLPVSEIQQGGSNADWYSYNYGPCKPLKTLRHQSLNNSKTVCSPWVLLHRLGTKCRLVCMDTLHSTGIGHAIISCCHHPRVPIFRMEHCTMYAGHQSEPRGPSSVLISPTLTNTAMHSTISDLSWHLF